MGGKRAVYFPPTKGLYHLKPGLHLLGKDFGNGAIDGKVFQIDEHFDHYRENMVACHNEDPWKYMAFHAHGVERTTHVNNFLVDKFVEEYPEHFEKETDGTDNVLYCHLTDEILVFDKNYFLKYAESELDPGYQNGFDALAMQVPTDIAILSRGESSNWLSAIHLCTPWYWSAQEKISKDFGAIHDPIPGFRTENPRLDKIVDICINKGPYTRFAWGVYTDNRLNHHPDAPPGVSDDEWHVKPFNPNDDELYFRVERQTTTGFPEIDAFMFTIRIYFYDVKEIKKDPEMRESLIKGINSMTPELLKYKKIFDPNDPTKPNQALLEWLAQE